jgi:hypothetical protein
MIGRLALRSLTAHPVRSAVLATGFGVGVAVMAILLGVAEIVLDQAQSPSLVGGGDVVIRLSEQVPAKLLMTGTLQSEALRGRVRAASPGHARELYLVGASGVTPVAARGGIPSLERALGDGETANAAAWRDSTDDLAWTADSPDKLLRQIDRFHEIPDAPQWAHSWAEWLYFNGRSGDARFYLTFLVGPRSPRGTRPAFVRLQLDRQGRVENFGAAAELTDAEVRLAPDLTIGTTSVRLVGMQYRIHLDLEGPGQRRAVGDLTLQASPGRLVPPIEVTGARGWRTGYVVPVMSGRLDGALAIGAESVSLAGGTGYHDHNWGFWQDVSWQWGQVQQGDLSLLYGRVFPPPEAADPDRIPGFMAALGPDGPLAFGTDLTMTETDGPDGRPRTIAIRARGTALELNVRFDVTSAVTTRMTQGPLGNNLDFLQLRGQYTVDGRAGERSLKFSAPGTAETFRDVASAPRR